MAAIPTPNDAKAFLKNLKPFRDWFELDVTLKLFGVTVFHWHYPPTGVDGHKEASVEVIDFKDYDVD